MSIRDRVVVLIPSALLLLLLFPLPHAGGPYLTRSFLVFTGIIVALAGLIALLGVKNKKFLVQFSMFPFLVIPITISFLILVHGQYGSLEMWVPVAAVSLSLGLAFFISLAIRRLNRPVGLIIFDFERAFLFIGVALSLLTVTNLGYLSLPFSFSVGGMLYPLTDGGFNQPNVFSTFLASILGFALWARFRSRNVVTLSANKQIVWFVSVLFLAIMVLWSQSRTGMIGLSCITGFWALKVLQSRGLRSFSFWFLTALVPLSILIVMQVQRLGMSDVDIGSRLASVADASSGSVDIRIGYLVSSWLSGWESPWIGHGLQQYKYLYPESFQNHSEIMSRYAFGGMTLHPHNEVANWWVSGGIVGVLGVLVAAVFGVVVVVRACDEPWSVAFLFLPLAFHCLTEYPLYISGATWLLFSLMLGCVLAVRCESSSGWVVDSGGAGYRVFAGLAICLLVWFGVLAVSALNTGRQVLANSQLDRENLSLAKYIVIRSDDDELKNWAYKDLAGWTWTGAVFQLAMAERNGQMVEDMLPKMKQLVREFNSRESWASYAAALAGLGKKRELIGFIDYISNLDAEYAAGMKAAYGL